MALHINQNSFLDYKKQKFDYNKVYFPTPGMLGTLYVGSDRYTVICLSNDTPKRISITDFPGESMKEILNNPNIIVDDEGVMMHNDIENFKKKVWKEDIEHWSLRSNGKWKKMNKDFSGSIHWGIADPYRDPDF